MGFQTDGHVRHHRAYGQGPQGAAFLSSLRSLRKARRGVPGDIRTHDPQIGNRCSIQLNYGNITKA